MASTTRSKRAKQIKQLQAKRANILGSAQLISDFADKYTESQSAEIPFRLQRLDMLWEDYEKVVTELDSYLSGEPHFSDDHAVFQNMYFRLKGVLSNKLVPTTPSTVPDQSTQGIFSSMRLPEIKLPEFNGNPEEWSAFHDLFKSMIHDNNSLSHIQKLHYFRASLKGEAARIISSLPIASTSYAVAWKLVTDRYEDKYLLIKQHIAALFSTVPLRRESPSGLSELADEFEKHVTLLDSLETKAQHWDSVLVELLLSRMDAASQKLWEIQRNKNESPTYNGLIRFIHEHSRTLQSLQLSQSSFNLTDANSQISRPMSNLTVAQRGPTCVACKEAHYLFQCESFRAHSPQDRFELVKRHNLCINCLKSTHLAKNCSGGFCKYCQRKHHTLLHIAPSPVLMATEAPAYTSLAETENSANQQQTHITTSSIQSHYPFVSLLCEPAVVSVDRSRTSSPPSVKAPSPSFGTVTPPSTVCQTSETSTSTVILYTALIKVRDSYGRSQLARALFDTGSQSSFISESLCQRLALNRTKVNMPISGIGEAVVNARYIVSIVISSRFEANDYPVNCLVLPKLTVNLPTTTIDISRWNIPTHLPLADPGFNVSHGIDIIIGAELFSSILQAEQVSFDEQLPVLQKTRFGYIIAGRVPTQNPAPVACMVTTLERLDEQIKRFWEIENFEGARALTVEEQQCENHFVKTHSRGIDGRYIVRLPVRQEMLTQIGETWSKAAQRFHAIEKRFRTDPTLRSNYVQFMEEYEKLGHMEEVKTRVALPQFFLPHHAIHRFESTTTKTRVVFDGSSKGSNHLSLNDLLLTGPTIQPTLLSIVLNFRLHQYVVTADIEKMYRQILVHPDDRSLQQVLWRKLETDPIKTYHLNTVTYGTSCAPFLATRTLIQLAEDEGTDFPLAAPIVRKNFYVDDLLVGSDNLDSLVKGSLQVDGLLARAGFSLRKWSANHPSLLEHMPENRRETLTELELDRTHSIKTLGLLWFPAEDEFGFKVPKFPPLTKVTKREALSEMSQLFDPLGLVGPIIAKAKMFVQQLWKENLQWDDKLPEKYQTWWLSYREKLDNVRKLRVPRWILGQSTSSYDVHCFVDASERGYGSCIYIVSSHAHTIKASRLLIAKSRVSPVRELSIPRLELCAAVLGSQLVETVFQTTNFSGRVTYWTDSTIVLHWISSPPTSWKVFVSNRVAEIQRLTKGSQWRHVPSAQNPADRISRGTDPDQLEHDNLWWNGPVFLLLESKFWPEPVVILSPVALELVATEQRPVVAALSYNDDDTLINKFSQLSHLLRVTAYCLRFGNNCRSSCHKIHGALLPTEYDNALKVLIRRVQHTIFRSEIQYLSRMDQGQNTLKDSAFKSPLKHFDLMLDTQGLLRINGRLANSTASQDTRFPILLPAKHHLTHLIAKSVHHQTLHAGPTQLLATLRQRFWPIRGRDLARRTVHDCITCFRCRPQPSNQFMAPLPAERITPAKVFEHTGLDYCGPFAIRQLSGRGASVKVWVAVYVCFAVKAVVLDIVAGLSTNACINSLRRFVSRVGRVSVIHCDNSTAFVGASREIKEMRHQFIKQFQSTQWTNECLERGIQFKFIPPRAPHFGGLWEAAVKSFKFHLIRIIGATPYHLDEFRTAISQAESILNSRPLTPLSNNPEDLSVLTPAHFLLGEPTFNLPEPDRSGIPINRLSHFQATQRSINDLWKRWSKEYISLLHQRPNKWRKKPTEFQIGTMVLLKTDHLPPKRWPLGRVVAIHPGADNVVRVVDVRTQAGVRRRATSELCAFPENIEPSNHTGSTESSVQPQFD